MWVQDGGGDLSRPVISGVGVCGFFSGRIGKEVVFWLVWEGKSKEFGEVY